MKGVIEVSQSAWRPAEVLPHREKIAPMVKNFEVTSWLNESKGVSWFFPVSGSDKVGGRMKPGETTCDLRAQIGEVNHGT
jgi:hypothetical protein